MNFSETLKTVRGKYIKLILFLFVEMTLYYEDCYTKIAFRNDNRQLVEVQQESANSCEKKIKK